MNPTIEEIKKQDIVDQLTWDDSVDANDVNVNVHDGTVELKGTVPSYAAKMAAERDAYMVPGVRVVKNDLSVKIPLGVTLPTDTDIRENIEIKLLWDSQLNDSNINVDATGGIVTLSGTVDSYWEKSLAEDIAYNTHGVTGVINHLTVRISESVSDDEIANDIRKAYKRNDIIDEKNINISVKDGIVNLSGTVPSYVIKKQAVKIAEYTRGVINVTDDIAVLHTT